jgi:hypothetical protein
MSKKTKTNISPFLYLMIGGAYLVIGVAMLDKVK